MIIRSEVSFTRPANTTAYSANDVIGPASGQAVSAFNFDRNRVNIVGAQVVSTATQDTVGVLYLVTSSSYAPGADNAAITLPVFADGLIGVVTLGQCTAMPSVLEATTYTIAGGAFFLPASLPATLPNGTIYCALQTPTGFTPASGQQFRISLFAEVTERAWG